MHKSYRKGGCCYEVTWQKYIPYEKDNDVYTKVYVSIG